MHSLSGSNDLHRYYPKQARSESSTNTMSNLRFRNRSHNSHPQSVWNPGFRAISGKICGFEWYRADKHSCQSHVTGFRRGEKTGNHRELWIEDLWIEDSLKFLCVQDKRHSLPNTVDSFSRTQCTCSKAFVVGLVFNCKSAVLQTLPKSAL